MTPEPLVHESRIKVPYRWSAGETGTRFLAGLRDEGRIRGTRCPGCRKAYVPPRRDCPACFMRCREWVEVGPEGTLVSFTRAGYETAAQPVRSPVYGLIRLDGADTAMLHLLSGIEGLRTGMRVRAVFREERRGSVLDIRHFEPA